ncbi:hypothetical protein M3J09_008225 [Ascochyta lentis]
MMWTRLLAGSTPRLYYVNAHQREHVLSYFLEVECLVF